MIIKIWNLYQYFFYRYYLYDACKALPFKKRSYLCGIGLLGLTNTAIFVCVLIVAQFFTGFDFLQEFVYDFNRLLVIGLFFVVFNHLLFWGKAKTVVNKFLTESEEEKKKGGVLAFVFFYVSNVLPVIVMVFLSFLPHKNMTSPKPIPIISHYLDSSNSASKDVGPITELNNWLLKESANSPKLVLNNSSDQ